MKVVVDLDLCQGHGQCVIVAPEIFDIDEEGYAVVINERPGDVLQPKLQSAINRCPAEAIKIEND